MVLLIPDMGYFVPWTPDRKGESLNVMGEIISQQVLEVLKCS